MQREMQAASQGKLERAVYDSETVCDGVFFWQRDEIFLGENLSV